MSTTIEWTATVNADGSVTPGSTWNPVTGCSKVSPGCAHCYAETVALRFWPTQYPPVYTGMPDDIFKHRPRAFTDVQCHEDRLKQPLRWKKPRKVFVNSMSDLFHEDVPDAFIDKVFAVMALAPQHTFQVLTKRADRMREYVVGLSKSSRRIETACPVGYALRWNDLSLCPFPLPNVWLGVSVENQHFADERIPLLLQTPAAVRFISAEPLLGAVDLDTYLHAYRQRKGLACAAFTSNPRQPIVPALDWVIVGGESGAGARPFNVAWARSIVGQCKTAGVPCFVKQLGSFPVVHPHDPYRDTRLWAPHVGLDCSRVAAADTVGGPRPYRPTLKSNKGGDPAEWPEDLRVREMPAVRV